MPLIIDNTPQNRHLALSTNNIEKISSLSGMDSLCILSLGRNLLKKIENVEAVADTLQELWLSYNQIEKLVGGGAGQGGGCWCLHVMPGGWLRAWADTHTHTLAMPRRPPHHHTTTVAERGGEALAAACAVPVQQPHQGLERGGAPRGSGAA
jgi:hypothetical protein